MTKEDIKKALKFCAKDHYYFCGGCSYDDVRNCNDKLKTDALNVIIEQEREIERLKAENDSLNKKISELEQDLIHADENVFYRECDVKLAEDKIKKQAQIDVLNKVKEKYGFYSCYSWNCDVKSLNTIIDELIKEVNENDLFFDKAEAEKKLEGIRNGNKN